MRLLYVSRQFNRSGYYVLEQLLDGREHEIAALLVPEVKPSQRPMRRLNSRLLAPLERLRYRLEVRYFRGSQLRFEGSLPRLAKAHGVDVIELPTLRGERPLELLRSLRPDVLVLGGGWPELISSAILKVPELGAINTHPSLLPAFRGTDVHRWQIQEGVQRTGVTIHYMDDHFDTGSILGQRSVPLQGTETPQELFDLTARAAAPLMEQVLEQLGQHAPDRAPALEQAGRDNDDRYFPAWPWGDDDFLALDRQSSAPELARFIRACAQESYRFRGPWVELAGTRYFVRRATVVPAPIQAPRGSVCVSTQEGTVLVPVAPGPALNLEQVQLMRPVPAWHRAHTGMWLARRITDRSAILPWEGVSEA